MGRAVGWEEKRQEEQTRRKDKERIAEERHERTCFCTAVSSTFTTVSSLGGTDFKTSAFIRRKK
jgi:hypothetical protein